MTKDGGSEFVRRKFTITESLDDVLVSMAEQNYQGNVSLCLRASIEDHRRTLNGSSNDEWAWQRFAAKLEDIETQHHEIDEKLTALKEGTGMSDESGQGRRRKIPESLSDDDLAVFEFLLEEENGFRISDLAEETGMALSRVQPAVGSLVDYGLVIDTGDSMTRVQPIENPNKRGGQSL